MIIASNLNFYNILNIDAISNIDIIIIIDNNTYLSLPCQESCKLIDSGTCNLCQLLPIL